MQTGNNFLVAINGISAVVVLAWYCLPALSTYARAVGQLPIFGAWLLSSHMLRPYWYLRAGKHWLWGLMLAFWMLTNTAIAAPGMLYPVLLQVLGYLWFFFPALFIEFYWQRRDLGSIKRMLQAGLLFVSVTCVTTLRGLAQNPLVARQLATAGAGYDLYSRLNIGGYGFVYASAILGPGLLHASLVAPRRQKLMLALSCALCCALVVRAGYTLALVTVIPATIAMLATPVLRKWLAPVALLAAAALVLSGTWYDALMRLPFISDNYIYTQRFTMLRDSIMFGEPMDRSYAYALTLDQLGNSSLWGLGPAASRGGHMQWLDHTVQYGIVGALPLVLLLGGIHRRLVKVYGTNGQLAGLGFLLVLLIGLVNNIASRPVGAVVFLILPAIMLCYERTPPRGATELPRNKPRPLYPTGSPKRPRSVAANSTGAWRESDNHPLARRSMTALPITTNAQRRMISQVQSRTVMVESLTCATRPMRACK